MAPAELIGFVGGGIGLFQALPQFRRIRRLGHGRGVSLSAWVLLFIVSMSWCGYGFRIDSPSQLVTNFLAGVLNGFVVAALLDRPRRAYLQPFVMLPLLGAAIFTIVQFLPLAVVNVLLVSLTLSRLPQVWKSLKHRRLRRRSAVSVQSLALTFTSLLCWVGWAALERSALVATTTTIALVITVVIAIIELTGQRLAEDPQPELVPAS